MKKLEKDFLKHVNAENEEELKEALRDILTRYKLPASRGGYSADFLVDQLYSYFYCMWCKFRNQYNKEKEKLKKS